MRVLAAPAIWGTWGYNGLILSLSFLMQKVGVTGTLSLQDCGKGENRYNTQSSEHMLATL